MTHMFWISLGFLQGFCFLFFLVPRGTCRGVKRPFNLTEGYLAVGKHLRGSGGREVVGGGEQGGRASG